MARERSVVVLCLPPHCSHRLQPLDVAFMKPIMTYNAQEVQNWLRAHPGRVLTTYQIAELFRGAYLSAATLRTATKGFEKAGIWPVNRNIFQKEDFAAAAPTDIPEEAHHINAPDVTHPADGPVVPHPADGLVVPQPVTGPVVPQPVTAAGCTTACHWSGCATACHWSGCATACHWSGCATSCRRSS